MVCPFCLHTKTNVYNSRRGTRLNETWRRRQCGACGGQFTTYERAEPGSILTVTQGRTPVPFSHHKLLLSVLRACDHRPDTDEAVPYLCQTIEQKLYAQAASASVKTITTDDITATTLATLQPYDPVAYVTYAGRHSASLDATAIRRALKRNK